MLTSAVLDEATRLSRCFAWALVPRGSIGPASLIANATRQTIGVGRKTDPKTQEESPS
jgi:hypothetical protein